MRDCTLTVDYSLFNSTFPAIASPYTLDLSKPYDAAVLSELISIAVTDSSCQFRNVVYKSDNGRETNLYLNIQRKMLVEQNSNLLWDIQESGIVRVEYNQNITMPSKEKILSSHGLMVLKTIILFARNVSDRKKYLKLLCADIICLTSQVQDMINEFISKKIIGAGGLDIVDIVAK